MKYILGLFLIVSLAGCESDAKHKNAGDVQKANCNGWFSDECTCSQGLKLIENKDERLCVDLKATNFCLATKNGFQIALKQKNSDVFASCLRFKVSEAKVLPLFNPDLIIALPDEPVQIKEEFAKWADSHGEILSAIDSWVTTNLQSGEGFLVGEDISPYVDNLLNPFLMPVHHVDYMNRFPAPKFFASAMDLIEFLENPTQKSVLATKKFDFDDRAIALTEFYSTDWQTQPRKVVEVYAAEGCAGSCMQETEPKDVKAFILNVREYIVEGKIFRSEIVIKDSAKNTVGSLYLADAKISVLILVDRDEAGLEKGISIYDSNGKRIFQRAGAAPFSASTIFAEREQWVPKTSKADYSIGICENDFTMNQFLERGIESHLQFGPHLASSYFGWVESPIDSRHFWQGRVFFNHLGLRYSNFWYMDHAAKVSHVAITNPWGFHIGLIPMGINECFMSDYINETWKTIRAQTDMRVVNMSVTWQLDEETCREKMQNHPISNSEDVLWVMAAGNDGSPQNIHCPQFLAGQQNVVIVGASTNGSMEILSNRGDWVDIAASGFGKEGGKASDGVGTSYAAPRVSRLAGKIFYYFPKLTAHQVKQSILLGSEHVSDRFPVLSRGELNEDRAMKYAESFHKQVDIRTAIMEIECQSTIWCEAAEKKSVLLEKIN